jgi:3-oxoacyl-[acyl-carrier protein] reductase
MSVLITGGGSGIGAATAARFASLGAKVTISGRRPDKVAAVVDAIGVNCRGVVGDVTVAADRQAMVDAAVEFGGCLDVLVNNAGNMVRASVAEWDEGAILSVLHSNVVAGMMLVQAGLPHLVARRGCVVFVSSVYTTRAFPGAAPYAVTKGAVETLTSVLASELGPQGVRVSCVRPGAVFTEINQRAGLWDDTAALARLQGMASSHALGRIGTTEEIAEAIEFVSRSEWITGDVLSVDGGLGLGHTHT